MKILLIDDDPAQRSRAARSLRLNEHTPVELDDGNEAWSMLQQPDAPRLVLSEFILPGLDGPDLCRRVRRLHPNRYTYFILLTKRIAKPDYAYAVRAGVDDYITKPCDEDELMARVNVGVRLLDVERHISRVHQHSRILLDETPFPVACVDSDGTVVDCNPAFAHVLGYNSTRDFVDHNIGERAFWNPVDYRALLQQISLEEPFAAVEVRLSCNRGPLVTMRLWGRPIEAEGRKLFHLASDYYVDLRSRF